MVAFSAGLGALISSIGIAHTESSRVLWGLVLYPEHLETVTPMLGDQILFYNALSSGPRRFTQYIFAGAKASQQVAA